MRRDEKEDESVLKALKYRLYPNKATEPKLEWVLARCCELYNAALQERREAYT
jgi:putative transposase